MIDYELRAARMRQQAMRDASPPEVKLKRAVAEVVRRLKPAKPKPDLWKLAQAIMGEVSECVPDGDPIDRLAPLVERCGLDRYDTVKWLDKACRKHLGCRSYNQYLIDAWDGWNEVCEPDQRMDNPWRPIKQRKGN